jgi:hypothetical protein
MTAVNPSLRPRRIYQPWDMNGNVRGVAHRVIMHHASCIITCISLSSPLAVSVFGNFLKSPIGAIERIFNVDGTRLLDIYTCQAVQRDEVGAFSHNRTISTATWHILGFERWKHGVVLSVPAMSSPLI